MATFEVRVDEDVLREAERVLNSLGMNVEVAVGIFLRRVIMEKGLPMTMVSSTASQPETTFYDTGEVLADRSSRFPMRDNRRITSAMVGEVWRAFRKYLEGTGEVSRLSNEVSEKTGMNPGSAFIYLTILANLVQGRPNTRVLKYRDLEYLMDRIEAELGRDAYLKAVESLKASVPYWKERVPGAFGERVEAYCRNRRALYGAGGSRQ